MQNVNRDATPDIDKLQEKVEDYKKTLAAFNNNQSMEELDYLKEKIRDMEQLVTVIQEQQIAEKMRLEQEISNLSSNLNVLKRTIFELTEKISSITFPPQPTELNIEEKKALSFNQLQRLFNESFTVENPPSRRHKTIDPIIPKTKSPNHLPDFNQPSSQKVFSVKLNSARSVPLLNAEETQHELELEKSETPIVPEPPSIPENPTKYEPLQKDNFEEQIGSRPPKDKESSLLRFFRKQ